MVLPFATGQQATPVPGEPHGALPHGRAGEEHGLADEHAVLLRELHARDEAIRIALGEGRWPDREIEALVGYLRYEVLDQATHEERLLFPLVGDGLPDSRLRGLADDHARLRYQVDLVAQAGIADDADRDTASLLETLDLLHNFLARHMGEEESLLSTSTAAGVESLRRPFRCHLWFPVTEGPLLDLDLLPHEFAHTAAIERFGRLRAGEQLLVRATSELDSLWNLLDRRLPGDFGWTYLEEGPRRWRAEVTRRVPE